MSKCVLLSNNNISDEYAFNELQKIIKPNMKVLCFCYASDLKWQMENQDTLVYGEERKSLYKHWANFGIEYGDFIVAPFPKDTTEIRYIKEKIKMSDVIFFNGGFMENIDFILKLSGLWNFILENQEGKIFVGSSAGALILQSIYHICPHVDGYYDYYEKKKGLGITKRYSVQPHYHKNNFYHKVNMLVCKIASLKDKVKIVMLGENGGLIFDTENEKEVIAIGEVYF